jgi:ubiquitin carboxyl-terminal hydrolase MINDY-3/4
VYPSHTRPLSIHEAVALRDVLFSGASEADTPQAGLMRRLNTAWLHQGIYVDQTTDDRGYGMIQRKGGPCGVLAAIQASAIRRLVFGAPPGNEGDVLAEQLPSVGLGPAWRRASSGAVRASLVLGLADVIWRCGNGLEAVLALPPRSLTERFQRGEGPPPLPAPRPLGARAVSLGLTSPQAKSYIPDGISEACILHRVTSWKDLASAVNQCFDDTFGVPRGCGVLCTLYSAVLSRGIDPASGLQTDWDTGLGESGRLIGAHNYATQELVSLLLTGKARSNVMDGSKRLGEGADSLLLRGIDEQSDVGMLTLFEHYGYVAVGDHFKRPRVPVWVVCSESHYTTLWGGETWMTDCELSPSGTRLDLFYWDGLARQSSEIRFSLSLNPLPDVVSVAKPAQPTEGPDDFGFGFAGPSTGSLAGVLGAITKAPSSGPVLPVGHPDEDPNGAPPLNLVLRTRWPGAYISWNGVDPWL